MKTFNEYTRNYRKEYDNYHAQPEQRERNAARSKARRLMVKSGKVEKFDKMDVHHKDNDPLNNEEENLDVTTQSWNRTEPRLRKEVQLRGSKKKVDEAFGSAFYSRLNLTQVNMFLSHLSRLLTNPQKVDKIKKKFNLKKVVLDAMGQKVLAFEELGFVEACWKGYKQLGMKKKGGKKVPNCVPEEEVKEADNSGKKLNDPFRLPSGSKKKFGVYVKNDKGNVVKVTFGDPNMEIKRDNPARLKAFRARHNCDDKKDKTTPGYWSCYQWRAGAKVDN
jgi:hypothetical protein